MAQICYLRSHLQLAELAAEGVLYIITQLLSMVAEIGAGGLMLQITKP